MRWSALTTATSSSSATAAGWGARSTGPSTTTLAGRAARSVGAAVRHDRIRVGLYDSVARTLVRATRDDKVRQTSWACSDRPTWHSRPRCALVAGLRADRRNRVDSLTLAPTAGVQRPPSCRPSCRWCQPLAQDRAVPQRRPRLAQQRRARHHRTHRPRSGDPPTGGAAAGGADRRRARPAHRRPAGTAELAGAVDAALGSELVYVGDAGATEASLASRRRGIEFNNRWQPRALAAGRCRPGLQPRPLEHGRPHPQRRRPRGRVGAPPDLGPWRASLQWRYLGSGALLEDNSVRAGRPVHVNLRLGLDLAAAGPGASARAASADAGRLQPGTARSTTSSTSMNRAARRGRSAVADRHVHPAEPRTPAPDPGPCAAAGRRPGGSRGWSAAPPAAAPAPGPASGARRRSGAPAAGVDEAVARQPSRPPGAAATPARCRRRPAGRRRSARRCQFGQQGLQPVGRQRVGRIGDARRAVGHHRAVVGVQRCLAGKAAQRCASATRLPSTAKGSPRPKSGSRARRGRPGAPARLHAETRRVGPGDQPQHRRQQAVVASTAAPSGYTARNDCTTLRRVSRSIWCSGIHWQNRPPGASRWRTALKCSTV
jgi:hypothetical protein